MFLEQVLEIEALKTEINGTEHKQLVANIVSLRARQHELQGFSSNRITYWYLGSCRFVVSHCGCATLMAA
jgi:hypothetical protein